MSENGTEHFKILIDKPTCNPSLGYGAYVDALADVIVQSQPQFAIGIFGGWGSGKTTLMESIKTRLTSSGQANELICVWFSAWRYEKEEHLIVPLLDNIREAIAQWSRNQEGTIRSAARNVAGVIGGVTEALLSGFQIKGALIPKILEVSFNANTALANVDQQEERAAAEEVPRSFYHASFRALTEAFTEFLGGEEKRRIVVFIDDLDRCLPQGALEVLESMKLFFDFPGFIFVVGLDENAVEWCIDARYAEYEKHLDAERRKDARISGKSYIHKIFQVPLTLAPVAAKEVSTLVDHLCKTEDLHKSQQIPAQPSPTRKVG